VDGYKSAQNSYPNLFDLTERISAAYVMHTMDWNKVRLQTGLRLKATQMDTLGYNVILYPAGAKNCRTSTGCGTPVPVTNNPSYVNVLPSVQMRYALTDDSNLRAAYARGLSRPDAYQLVPYVTEDDSTTPATVAIGNPAAKPSRANNYDLLFEQFLKPVGMIQAGLFYKQLSDPLLATQYTPPGGSYAGELVSQWINGGRASLYGFEVSYQEHLTHLPGVLGGLGIFANYSRTASHRMCTTCPAAPTVQHCSGRPRIPGT
jgi:TonB-dependent receptor